ncbi:sulfatase [Streptomyces shenzhenensis]|uniref:sulfatase n=1 Tax=Streptomyces shenzhenensis TaxID=943815 RepID=UPI001F487627|nr:sulfatase [Streptomyces shenzhenensis]
MSHLTPPRQRLDTDADASGPDQLEEAPPAPAATGSGPSAETDTGRTDDEPEAGPGTEAGGGTAGDGEPSEAAGDGEPSGAAQESTDDEPEAGPEPGPGTEAEAGATGGGEPSGAAEESAGPPAVDDRAGAGAAGSAPAEEGTGTAVQGAPAAGSARTGWFRRRRLHPRAAAFVRVGTTVLAAVFVHVAILVPDRLDRIALQNLLRLPVEALFLAIFLLVLPSRARRVAAVVSGSLIGLSTVLKCLDVGFYQTLARPFDLVFDWVLLTDAADWVKDSFGHAGEVLAVIGVIVLVVAVLVLSALAMVRLANAMARHRAVAVRTTLVLGVVWITCFTLSVQFAGLPFATRGYSQFLAHRVEWVREGLGDADVFKKQLVVDAYANTPSDQLLTGLRGKDVLFTFIESYGRVAIDDPAMAPETDATLKEGNARLKAAGFAAQSGWLRSPVTGAGSWLAHSTFLSGLWVKNQERYRTLTTSDRATLTSYFQKTGAWRTVGIVPGVRKAWPEGKYFGLDHIYDSTHLGYQGPYFSWTPVPDQFSLEAFQKLEHGKKNRDPIMAEIILASSHNPWSPIAHIIDWKDLGNGRIFYKIKKEGTNPSEVWKSAQRVRTEYRKAIQYSVDSLTQWVQRYGDDNTVLVFLGDHQPVPTVTGGGNTSRDVPITIVARDPKVLARVSGWGWTDGLKPADNAPEWAMNQFRDRFLKAFGPQG